MKNTVTTPLVSQNNLIDRLVVAPIKAVLATETDFPAEDDPSVTWIDEAEDATSYSEEDSSNAAVDDTSSDSSITDETTTADETAASPDTAVADDTQTVYADTSTTKIINSSIEGNFGSSGSEIKIKIVKPLDSDTITLKNSKNNLWVKSDRIKFDSKVEQGKWLLYNLASLTESGVVDQVTAINLEKGFFADGMRQNNEKNGSVRCYKYSLDRVELGNSLSNLGIPSDSIQNISGAVWIGIKDKLIRRLDLQVGTSPSSPFIQIDLSLLFSGYDIENTFVQPTASEVIDTTLSAQTSN